MRQNLSLVLDYLAAWHIVTLARDASATPARRQRDRYMLDRLSESSSPVSASATISDSQAFTAATTASSSATVRPCSSPWETSVVQRMCARSGNDDPDSTQARIMNSPTRDVVMS
jgi:putative salt-induced outer membrane protein YdiY